jgi:hypothetical protein
MRNSHIFGIGGPLGASAAERRLIVGHLGLTLAKRPSESHDIDSLRDVIRALARDSARLDHAEDKQESTS